MRQCLTSPTGGYYTTNRPPPNSTEATDQFGKAGDFITSPEISQVFGELVGIFFVAEWLAQGQPSNLQLIELGPGRGTLMSDMLRAIANFRDMTNKIQNIWLVEASPTLREAQHKMLCKVDKPMETTERGWRSTCKTKGLDHISVQWVEDMNFLPKDTSVTPFIVAHEFFDALPIHAFQSVAPSDTPNSTTSSSPSSSSAQIPQGKAANEWRELLVSPTRPPSTLNPPKDAPPEFELTLARRATRHSSYLPALSPRYAALLPQLHSSIEVSPESRTITATLAQLIGGASASTPPPTPLRRPRSDAPLTEPAVTKPKPSPSGAALIVDYGPGDSIPVNSLRGIQAHQRVSPFRDAGAVDLSADVDFIGLAEAALDGSDGVEVHGPVEQGAWLTGIGGAERVKQLMQKADGEETRKRIEAGWKRLIDRGPSGMGRIYKCLAIIPWQGEGVPDAHRRRPVGFGGDVAG